MICLKCNNLNDEDAIICASCGENLQSMYDIRAGAITRRIFEKPPTIACYTTAAGVYISFDGTKQQFTGTTDDKHVKKEINNLLRSHPNLSDDDCLRVDNPMRNNIKNAREILILRVYSTMTIPTPDDKRAVINLMGEAIDIQTGKDTKVFGQPNTDRILPRLQLIDVPSDLRNNYNAMHKYYTATKHSNKQEHIDLQKEIGADSGKIIVAKYFEAVRSIFEWYYRKNGLTDIEELMPIDYSKYGIKI